MTAGEQADIVRAARLRLARVGAQLQVRFSGGYMVLVRGALYRAASPATLTQLVGLLEARSR